MPKSDAFTKALRLLRLMLFYEQSGQRLRTSEIAERLGVDEDTAKKYIDELDHIGWLVLRKDGQHWIRWEYARADRLFVSLTMPEATALYLAGRLLSQIHDERNRHTILALTRIITAMPSQLLSPLRSLVEMAEQRAQGQSDHSAIFEALAVGWTTRRRVRLFYTPPRQRTFECLFAPYLLEPSAIGRTIYALGESILQPKGVAPGDLRTYKMERIEHAEVTRESFTVHEGFNGPELLARAWGVMYGDEDLVEVHLRFTPYVTGRVKETVWHPSQQLQETSAGCLWSAQIGDVTEIRPWIRGWGSDCEVLAPAELREEMIAEVRRLARRYGIAFSQKIDPDEPDTDLFDSFFGGKP
ncbi:MAG: WYL domain-containing protein [Ktedonobacteraceae bacterium]|nr:WYL domain-containing protein [Ktedonobacteraceae bacterium]